MYQAKNERRGSYRFYSPEMNEMVLKRRALEIDMRHAIEERQFVLYFQPRFEVSTLKIVSVEALLRWKHPEKGIVLPSEFIPLAEETGIINTIGLWALRNACFAMAKHDDLVVSVNLSPAQFRGGDIVAQVRQALEDSGLPAHRLELEVTEGLLVHDSEAALTVLTALKELGVQLAMDDFGTGYSSLSYLQAFPFDRLKIDQAFIADLNATSQARSIVQAILALARALKIKVTAEGVETAEQFMLLRAEHCAEVQGFLLAKPMPIKNLLKILDAPPRDLLRKLAA
jgi:EAL domain-containing protein (putative c-di-GMP-specific phosphodiesterase class I)